jgi:hypothetical protein
MRPALRRARALLFLATISMAAAAATGYETSPTASPSPGFPLRVPTGSYMLTCARCTFESMTRYSCECRQIDGSPRLAQIDLAACTALGGFYFLDNQNGYLTCHSR